MNIDKLTDKKVDSLDEEEAKMILKELKTEYKKLKVQLQTRYKYLVGEWALDKRAKSTQDGKFVDKKEVIDYLS